MNIVNEEQLDFDDVMIAPQPSKVESRKDTTIVRPYKFKYTGKVIEGNPAMAANMATTGTFEMAKEMQKHQMFCALHKHYTAEQLIEFLENNKKEFGTNDYIFISTGLRKDDFTKLNTVMKTGLCRNICLDAPNGYIQGFVQHLNRLRHTFPDSIIMAGNVVTPEKTVELIHNGADVVKLGIGSGSACATRVKAGVGRPQLSTIIDCVSASKRYDGLICSDGGVKNPADYVKAIGVHADFVMMGGMLAGCSEAGGKLITKLVKTPFLDENNEELIEERKYKLFYGMSSGYAQDQHYDGLADYRASEGIVTLTPYKGPVKDTIQDLEGGLRSAMTYVGAKDIQEFPHKITFYKVRRQINRTDKTIDL